MGVVLAAGIGLAGAAISSRASSKAAEAQTQASEKAAEVQRETAVQARIDAYPWAFAGASALYQYMDEMGLSRPVNPVMPDLGAGPLGYGSSPSNTYGTIMQSGMSAKDLSAAFSGMSGGGNFNSLVSAFSGVKGLGDLQGAFQKFFSGTSGQATAQQPAMTPKLGFQQTPGYQFRVQQGEQGVLNNLSALGMKNSGKALKSLESFRQGLASEEYGNYLNRLASMAGMGQTQVNSTNSLMANAAGNIGNSLQNAGAARASGYVGSANALSQGLNGVGNALGQMSYNQFPAAPGGGLY